MAMRIMAIVTLTMRYAKVHYLQYRHAEDHLCVHQVIEYYNIILCCSVPAALRVSLPVIVHAFDGVFSCYFRPRVQVQWPRSVGRVERAVIGRTWCVLLRETYFGTF